MATFQQVLEVISSLPEKDRGFASSLAGNVKDRAARGGVASTKEQYWLDTMFARAGAPSPQPARTLDNMAGILAMFDRVASNLKHKAPALTFNVDDVSVRLSVAGGGAKFPGSINITSEGAYADRQWFGRIKRDGAFDPARNAPTGLGDLLTRFAADPLGVAAEHGKRTGRCCFCNVRLTAGRSVELGYGPICEGRWVGRSMKVAA